MDQHQKPIMRLNRWFFAAVGLSLLIWAALIALARAIFGF